MDQIFIQRRFSEKVEINGTIYDFEDALVLPLTEYMALTPAQIEQEKQSRIDSFTQNIINSSSPDIGGS